MSKSINPSTGLVNIYQTLFRESAIPFGLIQWKLVDEKHQFFISEANPALLNLLMIENIDIPIETDKAFALFKGYNNHFLEHYLENSNQNAIQITYQVNEKHIKVHFSKLSIQGISFHFEDVTALQISRKELLERKRQLKESHEIAKLGYWIENHGSNNHFWSDQVFTLLQAIEPKIEPSFQNFLTYVHPEDRQQVEELFNEAKATNTGFELTLRLLLKDGTTKYANLRCYTNYNSKGKAAQTIGITQDITHLENTRKALKKSETIFRSVFENAPVAIVLVNSNYSPNFCNKQFSQITGYSMDEILQLGLQDFTYPDDYSTNLQQYKRLFNNEITTFSLTKRYKRKDGTLIWVKVIVSAIKNDLEETAMAIAMVQDISAEKRASEALIKSEYKYRTLIENASDGIGLFDLNFNPIIYNTNLYEMLGLTLENYLKIDHKNHELCHTEDKVLAKKAFESILQKKPYRVEARLKNTEGVYKYFSINYIPVLHEEKPAILIFRRDISKRKEAELQNEEYRLFLETIMDNLPVSFFAKTTPDFRYLYWNHAIEQVTGIEAEEAIGKTDLEIQQSKALANQYLQEDEKLLKHKKKLEHEHSFTNSMGELKHFKTIKTIHQSSTGNPLILGLSMDITKLKEAEQQIEQSTQMLKEAQKIAKLGYWEYDVKKDLFFDNHENRQILGTSKVPYFLSLHQFIELVHPTEQNAVLNTIKNCIVTNSQGEGIIRVLIENEIKHVAINYRPIVNEKNEVIKLRGTCLDISRIRKSETALRESETRLKQAEHIAKVGYWDYNYKKKTTQFSDEVWNILEMDPKRSSINFSDFINAVHPDDKQAVFMQYKKSNETNLSFNFDFKIITHNNNLKYISAIGTFIKNQDGELERSIGTFQDTTSFKQNEFKLQKATSHLLNIQKLAKTGYIELNLTTRETYFSDSLYEILEVNPSDLKATLENYNNFIHVDDKNTIIQTFNKNSLNRESYTIQYRIQLKSGKTKYVNEIYKTLSDRNQNKDIVTRIIQDVTNLKEKEFEHTQLVQLKKNAQIGIWKYDRLSNQYTYTKEALEILGLAQDTEKLSFAHFASLIHPEDRFSVEKVILKSFESKKAYNLTYRIVLRDTNKIKYIQDNFSLASTKTDSTVLTGTLRDITDYRQTLKTLTEHSELMKIITENAQMGMVIFQNDKHTYVNKKWGDLLGLSTDVIENKLSMHEMYEPDTVRVILSLLVLWSRYKIKEYRNELEIKPLNAPSFQAEIYIKEITHKQLPAFLILVFPKQK